MIRALIGIILIALALVPVAISDDWDDDETRRCRDAIGFLQEHRTEHVGEPTWQGACIYRFEHART
jgi:hypothetical protein